MKADFWHEKWHSNEIGFDQAKVNPLLQQHFAVLGLTPHSKVFVPLCGKSIDMVWLLEQGMHVVGVELSEDAIKRFFAAIEVAPAIAQVDGFKCYQAEQLTIYVGDIFALKTKHVGDIAVTYDRASLVALPEEMRLNYCQYLRQITSGAPQLLITFDYDQSAQDGPPFSISASEVAHHYANHYAIKLLASVPVKGGLKGGCDALEELRLLQ